MNALIIAGISVRQDAEGRFCLNDLHKAAVANQRAKAKTHQPANFMRRNETKALEGAIVRRSSDLRTAPSVVINGGKNGEHGTFVCRQMVYAYAMWIDADFHLDVIEAFDAMQQANLSAWQALQAVIAQEVESKVRAQFGSYLMIQRKREIHQLKARIEELEYEVQPLLPLH